MAKFGDGDTSYRAAGEREGLASLVDDFYANMQAFPEAREILEMHAKDLSAVREKLTVFLAGWLGGPRTYAKRFGPIRIPAFHAHLSIGQAERDAWMLCMARAVEKQNWTEDFKAYFLEQIAVPADRVLQVSKPKLSEEPVAR